MSNCKKCFEKYQTDGVLLIEELKESFENYSNDDFDDGHTNYIDNYVKALNAIYHQNLNSDDEQIVEYFNPQVDFNVQNQLFNSGDYVDYYHNLYSNI
jgi:hypothetical protein